MFFFKKKQKDEDIRSPSGFGAVVHKMVMFLTYPFRKPLYLLLMLVLILVAAYCVPLYYGVKPLEVHTWYMDKAKNINKGDFSKVSKKFSNLINKIPLLAEEPGKGTDRLVEIAPSAKEVRRQIFQAASGNNKPQRVDVLAEEAADVVTITPPVPQSPETQRQNDESTQNAGAYRNEVRSDQSRQEKPVIVKKVSEQDGNFLRYLDTPIEVSGAVKIHNANEMEVGGTYLFLYGVYSNPRNARGVKAAVFLRDALKGETVNCKILAYTADDVATGECFVDDISINNILVERGYSDRVTLQ